MSSIRPVRAVLLAGSLGLVAACGSSSSGGPATQLKTAAEATTFANSVNLKTADLPGFKATAAEQDTASDKQQAQELATCSGSVDPSKDLADVNSDDFDRGDGASEQDINSEVTILPSTAEVKQDLAALTSAKGQNCLKAALAKLIAGEGTSGVKFGAPTLTASSVSVPNSQGTFKDRVTFTATGATGSINAVIDVLGVAVGQAEVELQTLTLGSPLDDATEQKLLALLGARANGSTGTAPSIPPATSGAATS